MSDLVLGYFYGDGDVPRHAESKKETRDFLERQGKRRGQRKNQEFKNRRKSKDS